MAPGTHEAARRALDEGSDPRQALEALKADTSAEGAGLRLALQAQLAQTEATRLDPNQLSAVGEGDAAGRACLGLARLAWLRADRPAMDTVALTARRLAGPRAALAHVWARIAAGEGPQVGPALDQLQAGARQLLPEIFALRGLAMEGTDDGLEAARRASLMAQSEAERGAPHVLPHLVLARGRRLTGKPHLAARILWTLAREAPPAWRGWIIWEALLAAGESPIAEAATDWPHDHLTALLASARAGNRPRFTDAQTRLTTGSARWPAADVDARALVELVDPATAATNPFLTGAAPRPPRGLHGTCTTPGAAHTAQPAVGYAFCARGRARRVLAPGLGLLLAELHAPTLLQPAGRLGRIETAIASLILAGEAGLSTEAFFLSVYGFPYNPDLHGGALRVLRHRVAEALGGHGTLDAGWVLHAPAGLVIADPRCATPLEHRLLHLVATSGHVTARDLADLLAAPLRTVQASLKELVEQGLLRAEGKRNNVEYWAPDTVFSDPGL